MVTTSIISVTERNGLARLPSSGGSTIALPVNGAGENIESPGGIKIYGQPEGRFAMAGAVQDGPEGRYNAA
jgi:hypothetical protein